MDLLIKLLDFSEYIFWFIIVFSLIVFIHEFGHYYIAKLNNVEIEKFSIGFGPAIFKFTDKSKTIWQLSAIPLGGYVKFAGEMYANENTDPKTRKNKKLFLNKSALQKASIVAAGPVANFILGILIFILIFVFFGKNFTAPVIGKINKDSPAYNSKLRVGDKIIEINQKQIESFEEIYNLLDYEIVDEFEFLINRDNASLKIKVFPEHKLEESIAGTSKLVNYVGFMPNIKPIINNVSNNSPAQIGGLKSGDTIIKINSINVSDIEQVINIIKKSPNIELLFNINRKGNLIEKTVKPKMVQLNDSKQIGRIGITFSNERKKMNVFDATLQSVKSFYDITLKTLNAFVEIIFGKRDHCEMGGPIMIAKVSNEVANTDLVAFVSLIAIISFNLGIINLFPLPLLDGGHLFTYIAEYFTGREIKYSVFKYVQIVGVLIIFSLMSFSIINDVYCRVLN